MGLISRISDVLFGDDNPQTLGLQALASESTLSSPQPWMGEAFGGVPTGTGKVVSIETAARFTAVNACVQVLEHSVGQIPCELMRRTKGGGSEPATDHSLYELVRNLPNAEMTAQDDRELAMNHLCFRGNAFHQIVRSAGGDTLELNPLMPDWIRVFRNSAGKLNYEYTAPNEEKRTFSEKEVWRIAGRTRNGITGVSPITENREAIGLGIASEEHGAKLFANGAQIATAFEHPGKMSKDAQDRLRQSLNDRYSGSRNAFKTIVIEEGMKVAKLGMSNVDSQFIELRKFQIEEICRIFCVPPHKIQHLDRATFNNIEHLTMDFVTSSLAPWLVKFTSTMYRDLLTVNERKRLYFRFDTDPLLDGDKAAMSNYYASALSNRWMNPNEVRVKRGLNPYEGGDKFENPNTTSSAPGAEPGAPIPAPAKG